MCSRPRSTRKNSSALTTITATAAGTTHEITIPPPIGNSSSAGRSASLPVAKEMFSAATHGAGARCQHRVLQREHRQNRDGDDERHLRRDACPHDTVAEAAEDVHGAHGQ